MNNYFQIYFHGGKKNHFLAAEKIGGQLCIDIFITDDINVNHDFSCDSAENLHEAIGKALKHFSGIKSLACDNSIQLSDKTKVDYIFGKRIYRYSLSAPNRNRLEFLFRKANNLVLL